MARCLALPLILSTVAAAPASAFEHTRFEALHVLSIEAGVTREVPALLNLPQGWRAGDPAAVLLFDPTPGAFALRDTLLVALLDVGTAVLELDSNTVRGISAESSGNPPAPTAGSLLHDLAGALVALRGDVGAGPVMAIGHGLGGAAALLASDGAWMAAELGEDGPRFTALAALGPDRPAFVAVQPATTEAGRFCAALAWAQGAVPPPVLATAEATRQEAADILRCRTALAPSPVSATAARR